MPQPDTPVPVAREGSGSPVFVTTRWSLVLSAGAKASPDSIQALEDLCRTYWYPLYAYIRRLGHAPADAEDLTQAFFARLLQKEWLAAADRERGRFRSFLLAALKHFLANEWDRARAQKRGGRHRIVPLDTVQGENQLTHEQVSTRPPDREFDRRWALALLDAVLARLGREYVASGKGPLFEQLKASLSSPRSEAPYAQLARQLGMREGAVRVAVHRLRQRYRQLLRDEIAQTVADPVEIEAELRHLLATLSD